MPDQDKRRKTIQIFAIFFIAPARNLIGLNGYIKEQTCLLLIMFKMMLNQM